MQAGETTLNKLLNTSRQFIVPIFQRNYSWQIKQQLQLWTDILRASNFSEKQNHFIGSIVYIDMGTPAGRPQQLLLIDGQQRIATVSILLCALKKYIQTNHIVTKLINLAKINNQFLINIDELNEDKYKLLLNIQDKDTYINLLEETDYTVLNPSINITDCYKFYYNLINEYVTKGNNIDMIYQGILNLNLVAISLDKEMDSPQLIFESMNATGKDLSQTDLLKNYLLMDLAPEKQQYLYKTYWLPIEKLFGMAIYQEEFDYFVRDFLTIKSTTGQICKINDVYETFKRYYLDENWQRETILKELFIFAKYYANMNFNKEEDKELYQYWQELQIVDSKVVYPFFLQIYRDYANKMLMKTEFILIIKMTINYLCRRAICDLSTNSLSKTFANLYQEIDKNNYVNSMARAYIFKAGYKRFPSDYEVREKLQLKDMYHFRLKKYILEKLEIYQHKEPIDIVKDNYTIEHIMPQNIQQHLAWQKELGENWQEAHEIYLHTLGNLTITAYNAELSNRSFTEKLNSIGGFKDSHLRLNKTIAKFKNWDSKAIQSRTNILIDLFFKVWEYPYEKY